MQSVVVAYSLTMAMLIPASGWIADRFGTRRVYVSAITLFVIGSVACALSHSLTQLVIARVLQGLGGAMLLPVGRLAVLRAFPRQMFLPAISFISIPGLIGPMIGPTLGGWLVEVASWHWIFLINVPVGVLGCVATLIAMKGEPAERVARFDFTGYVLLAFGMVSVSLALDGLAGLGLRQASVLVMLVFGLASLVAYWLHAARRPDPLFSPALFSIPTLSIGLLGNLFSRLGSSCMPFLVPLMLQVGMGYPPMHAGLMMLPVAIAGMVVKQLATPLITRAGYRRVLLVNTALIGVVMASFALTSPDRAWWWLSIQLACFGATNSLQFTAMNTLTLKDIDRAQASSGNSLLSMVQMLAMGIGVALAGALLSGYSEMWQADPEKSLRAIHATFMTVALMTLAATLVVSQLDQDEPVKPAPDGGDA
jgi:EmrB/QacA subfamily drug resistance transporter